MNGMNKDFAVKKEQEKAVELILEILDVDREVGVRIRDTVKEVGIEAFLFNIHRLDFSYDIKEKVNALKEIILMNDNYRKDSYPENGGDMDDQ